MKFNIPGRVMKDITASATRNSIHKVILFGSRARGTHYERSDIDIAVEGGNFELFYWEMQDEAQTLLSFDIVNLNSDISEELKREIEKEGVVIYEKT